MRWRESGRPPFVVVLISRSGGRSDGEAGRAKTPHLTGAARGFSGFNVSLAAPAGEGGCPAPKGVASVCVSGSPRTRVLPAIGTKGGENAMFVDTAKARRDNYRENMRCIFGVASDLYYATGASSST
jgi:hypothetical protein